jgi:hypothetical protein
MAALPGIDEKIQEVEDNIRALELVSGSFFEFPNDEERRVAYLREKANSVPSLKKYGIYTAELAASEKQLLLVKENG